MNNKNKILICGPSNNSVDNILKKLQLMGLKVVKACSEHYYLLYKDKSL